ncbi:DUF4235 domain-containing protein [Cellulomonas sp. P22]|uniref:DUF4235 domain-containing protein n=1 Tax=Cellulomonas sp. P22 TaxID=3373189 RepID=UPI0037874F91
MNDEKQSMLAKIAGTVVALAAAWAAQKAITVAWKAATGHQPPKPDDEGDAGVRELVAAAAVSGAVVAISRVLATRGTATFAARVNRNRHTAA